MSSTQASKACLETPAAVSEGYDAKGSYATLAETKCYLAGPQTATKAIFFFYDIFGLTEQTLQGADILASHGAQEYAVVMPDLLGENVAQPEWLTNPTEENKEKREALRAKTGQPEPFIDRAYQVFDAAKKHFPHVQKWGSIGYCWGGKLVALTSGPETKWAVSVVTSPSRVDPEDGKKVTVPYLTLGSKGESVEDMTAFHQGLTTPNTLHVFSDQVHGWMSARADLKDAGVKKEYERGYRLALDFFAEHL